MTDSAPKKDQKKKDQKQEEDLVPFQTILERRRPRTQVEDWRALWAPHF